MSAVASGASSSQSGVGSIDPGGIHIREAMPQDNHALIELASVCPMDGDVSIRVDRAPDIFALNALEGSAWKVGVAQYRDSVVGCAAASTRHVWLNGRPSTMGYASDLKVHPDWRGTGTADALSHWVSDTVAEWCGAGTPTMLTILGGNSRMERRARGPRGTPPDRQSSPGCGRCRGAH